MIGSMLGKGKLKLMFITVFDVAKKYTATSSLVDFGTMRPNKSSCTYIPSANRTKQRVLTTSHCNYKVRFSINHYKFFAHTSRYSQFSGINISQGSVATFVRCGEILNNSCIANLQRSLAVKKISKID